MISLELKNKLSVQCLHPRTIRNRYTGDLITVPCGCCHACILKRSSVQTNILTTYSTQFKYIYFVTLTYADKFLPVMSAEIVERAAEHLADAKTFPNIHNLLPSDDRYVFGFRSIPRQSSVKVKGSFVNRVFNDEEFSFTREMTVNEYLSIRNKIRYPIPNRIPYCCSRDLDLFLKRLRINYANEKLRYYAVSEYGPTSYRPHWHLLLFTNSEQVSKTIIQNVCKAWSYGRVDASLSRGFAAPYVASYVNSFVSLPSFYVSLPKGLRAKSFHSIGFRRNPQFRDNASVSEVEDIKSLYLDGLRIQRDGFYSTIYPDWSHLVRVFPRFSDSFRGNVSDICQLLVSTFRAPQQVFRFGQCSLNEFFDWGSKTSIIQFCKKYLQYVRSFSTGFTQFNGVGISLQSSRLPYPDVLICTECRLLDGVCLSDNLAVSRLYRHFLRCSKFFSFWNLTSSRESDIPGLLKNLSIHICDFWQKYDYKKLTDFYLTLESNSDKEIVSWYLDRIPYQGIDDFRAQEIRQVYPWIIKRPRYTLDSEITEEELANYGKLVPPKPKTLHDDLDKLLAATALQKCRDKVKHKVLNDSLGIFIN